MLFHGRFHFAHILLFILGIVLCLWLPSRFRRRQDGTLAQASFQRRSHVFDWQTALVFAGLSVGIGWLFRRVPIPESDHAWKLQAVWWKCFPALCVGVLQGLWLGRMRSGPGHLWIALSILYAVHLGLLIHYLPAALGTSPWDDGGLLWIAEAQFWHSWQMFDPAYTDSWELLWSRNAMMTSGWLLAGFQAWALSNRYRHAWIMLPSRLCATVGLGFVMDAVSIGNLSEESAFWAAVCAELIFFSLAIGVVVAHPRRSTVHPQTSAGSHASSEWRGVVKSLKRCRSLEDPSRTVRHLFGWVGVLLGMPVLLWASFYLLAVDTGDRRFKPAFLAMISMAPAVLWSLVILYLTPSAATRPNAFIVRAFRRDEQTSQLRDLVSVALGPRGRLFGIRDPRQRFGIFTRFFATLEGTFRYLGSNLCDLEGADRNWLARVLATLRLREVDFVIIDLREITPYVTVEIGVVARAMTQRRVIWLVDDSQPREAWLKAIQSLIEDSFDSSLPVHLLDVHESDAPDSGHVIQLVRRVLAEAPHPWEDRPMQEALVRAHALAQAHVRPKEWKTPWWETLSATVLTVAVAMALAGWGFRSAELSEGSMVLVALVALFGLFVSVRTVISGFKALRSRFKLARLGRKLAPDLGW